MAIDKAWVDVTLASGVGTGSWLHPDQVSQGGSADVVQLDRAPIETRIACTSNDQRRVGVVKVEASSTTAVRLVSTHNSDASTWRVWAFCAPAGSAR